MKTLELTEVQYSVLKEFLDILKDEYRCEFIDISTEVFSGKQTEVLKSIFLK